MAFTQPTLPIRSGPLVTSVGYVNNADVDTVIIACDQSTGYTAQDETSAGLTDYVSRHPLLKSFGLVMTWGAGGPPVIENEAGGGTPRPSVGVMWPRD